MKFAPIIKVCAWLAGPVEPGGRRDYRRFAIPYSFKPELSVGHAVIFTLAAFMRIFLGSILFAVYGWNALVRWNSIQSPVGRVVAIPPLLLVFLVLFALLMAAISALVRRILSKS